MIGSAFVVYRRSISPLWRSPERVRLFHLCENAVTRTCFPTVPALNEIKCKAASKNSNLSVIECNLSDINRLAGLSTGDVCIAPKELGKIPTPEVFHPGQVAHQRVDKRFTVPRDTVVYCCMAKLCGPCKRMSSASDARCCSRELHLAVFPAIRSSHGSIRGQLSELVSLKQSADSSILTIRDHSTLHIYGITCIEG